MIDYDCHVYVVMGFTVLHLAALLTVSNRCGDWHILTFVGALHNLQMSLYSGIIRCEDVR